MLEKQLASDCHPNLKTLPPPQTIILAPTAAIALDDLCLLFPEMSREEVANHTIKIYWCRRHSEIEQRKTGTNPFHKSLRLIKDSGE